MSEINTSRARLGGLIRRGADAERVEAARRDLITAQRKEYARKLVADWPELTPEAKSYIRAAVASVHDGEVAD